MSLLPPDSPGRICSGPRGPRRRRNSSPSRRRKASPSTWNTPTRKRRGKRCCSTSSTAPANMISSCSAATAPCRPTATPAISSRSTVISTRRRTISTRRKVYPQFLDANRVDGKLWALPYYSFGAGVIYRKDLFDKYGIAEFPKTTEELEKALQTIKDGLAKDGNHDHLCAHHARRAGRGAEPRPHRLRLCLCRLSGLVRRRRRHARGDQGEKGASRSSPAISRPGFETFVRWSKEFGPPGIATHTWVDMMNLYGAGPGRGAASFGDQRLRRARRHAGPERQGSHRLRAEPDRPVRQADPEFLDVLGRHQQISRRTRTPPTRCSRS